MASTRRTSGISPGSPLFSRCRTAWRTCPPCAPTLNSTLWAGADADDRNMFQDWKMRVRLTIKCGHGDDINETQRRPDSEDERIFSRHRYQWYVYRSRNPRSRYWAPLGK